MYKLIYFFLFCLLTINVFAQGKPSPKPSTIDPKVLLNIPKPDYSAMILSLPQNQEIIPFWDTKEWSDFFKKQDCGNGIAKLLRVQITFINTKEAEKGQDYCMLQTSDNSQTFYYSGEFNFSALKNTPANIVLSGNISLLNQFADFNAYPYPGAGALWETKFKLLISTSRQKGATEPYDLKMTINDNQYTSPSTPPNIVFGYAVKGIGVVPMKYQFIGNNTIYANNGRQILIVTLGHSASGVPN